MGIAIGHTDSIRGVQEERAMAHDVSDFFVPDLLNTLVGEQEAEARAVLEALAAPTFDESPFIAPSETQRANLERERYGRLALMFETLTDKYDQVVRTHEVLN